MSNRVSRRRFIQGSTAVAGLIFLPHLGRGATTTQANDRLNIANIGVGGQGGAHLGAAGGQNLVAICDIDEGRLGGVAKRFPKARTFTDYRRMLDRIKEIDAVMVATPDHSHYPACMMAMQLGKHAFCEKPLTNTIWQARQLAKIAAEKKLATQMGNQGHSGEGNRVLCEFVWDSAVGPVKEVHAWTDRPIWPQGISRPAAKPVPKNVHWDEWLGPAPAREYHDNLHPFAWRGWVDFGTGALGDMGCHILDGAVWALKLGEAATVKVSAELPARPASQPAGTDWDPAQTYPKWSILTFEFPARGKMQPVKLVWYDGNKRPPRPADLEPERKFQASAYFVGEKGTLISQTYGGCRIVPEAKMKEYKLPAKTIARSKGMHADWIAACKGGKPASSNFVDSAARLTEICLLGAIAQRLGRPIEYDFTAMKFVNDPAADSLLKVEPRNGWEF